MCKKNTRIVSWLNRLVLPVSKLREQSTHIIPLSAEPIDKQPCFCDNIGNDTGNDAGTSIVPNQRPMRRNRKAITIQDVAKAAGVSVSTVSRVLNNKDDVAFETVDKVRQVIGELQYSSSLAARGMRSHHTNVIGLIIPEVASPFCHEILRGVNRAIAELNKDLLIYTSGGARKENIAQHEQSYVSLLNGGITDGIIVVTPTATNFTTHAPVVIIDPNNESPDFPSISSTNREGALAAINYLTGLGHRRIGFIAGRMELVSANQRLQGYRDGLAAAGIPFDQGLIEIGDYATRQAILCARKLISLPDRPTAIFAANDMTALGVYQAAKEAGLNIPNDLSVVGFDNLDDSSLMVPALTTVDQSVEEIGTIATEMINSLINDEKLICKQHIIQTRLIIRDSCAPFHNH